MTTGAAIKQGFRLARRAQSAAWVLFLGNLGLAALAGLPIYRGLLRFTGRSLMSKTLAHAFSVDWLTDYVINSPGSLERYATVISLVGLLAIPVNAVLAGGVLEHLRSPEGTFSPGDFFRGVGRNAWRLIRLMSIGLICYWIVFRLLNTSLANLVDNWTRDSLDDRPLFWAHLSVGLVVILGLGFVNLVIDYARVKLVMEEGSSAIEAFLASLGFCLGRLPKALIPFAIPSLGGLALLGVYLMVATPAHSALAGVSEGRYREPLMLALVFMGQQAVVLGRAWFRVATWASEWTYYSGSR